VPGITYSMRVVPRQIVMEVMKILESERHGLYHHRESRRNRRARTDETSNDDAHISIGIQPLSLVSH